MFLCLSLCIRVLNSLVPTHSLFTCTWIPCRFCRFSHCENGSFKVLSLHLMMAALLGWTQAECFAWDGKRAVHAYLPIPIWIGRFKKPADVSPVVWNRSGSPQWCEAQRRWQRAVCKSSVNSTCAVSVAASPCFSIEITCIQVNLLTNHDDSDFEDELFCNTPFWCVDICRDNTIKVSRPLSGGRRNEARESTPCTTHPWSLSITWSGKSSLVSWRYMDLTSMLVWKVSLLKRIAHSP